MYLDRQTLFTESTFRPFLLIIYCMDERLKAFERLLSIMDDLRTKCPWDREQTYDSLRCLTIEETYELSDAIVEKNYSDMCKELGDLMLHVVFYSKIAEEEERFDITQVLNQLCDKLVRRHPHIYGNVESKTADQVLQNWEKIKLQKEGNRSVLGGVPKSLPALIKAFRIQEKVSGVGFDWNNRDEVWDKVQEEISELQQEVSQNSDNVEDEMGDVFFALINYCRFLNLNPEDALEKTNRKFIRRFQYIEQQAKASGRKITDLNLEEMEAYWQEAKTQDHSI